MPQESRIAKVEKTIEHLDVKVDAIMENHLPGLAKQIGKLEGTQKTVLLVFSAILGSGVLGGIVALCIKLLS